MIFKNELLNLILLLLLFKIFYDYNNDNIFLEHYNNKVSSVSKNYCDKSISQPSYTLNYNSKNPDSNLNIKINDILNYMPYMNKNTSVIKNPTKITAVPSLNISKPLKQDTISEYVNNINKSLDKSGTKKNVVHSISLKDMLSKNEFKNINNINPKIDMRDPLINKNNIYNPYGYLTYNDQDHNILLSQYKIDHNKNDNMISNEKYYYNGLKLIQ